MRYAGQGHEIVVALPVRRFAPDDARLFRDGFEATYRRCSAAPSRSLDMEIVSWTLRATAVGAAEPAAAPSAIAAFTPVAVGRAVGV